MQFKTLLATLHSQGRADEADYYERAVTQRFMDLAPPEFAANNVFRVILTSILKELTIDEIAELLKQAPSKEELELNSYVKHLRAQGFSISERYLKCQR